MEPRQSQRQAGVRNDSAMERLLQRRTVTRQDEPVSTSTARTTGAVAGAEAKRKGLFGQYSEAIQPLGQWAVRAREIGRNREASGRQGLWSKTPDTVYGALSATRDFATEAFVQAPGRAIRKRVINTPEADLKAEFKDTYGFDVPNRYTPTLDVDENGRVLRLSNEEVEQRKKLWEDFQIQSNKRIYAKTAMDRVFMGDKPIGTPFQEAYETGYSIAESAGYKGEELDKYARDFANGWEGKAFGALDFLDLWIIPAGVTRPVKGMLRKMVTNVAERQAARFAALEGEKEIVRILTDEQKVASEVAEMFASQLARTTDPESTTRLLETVYEASYDVRRATNEVDTVVRSVANATDDSAISAVVRKYADEIAPVSGVSDDIVESTVRRISSARAADDLTGIERAVSDLRTTVAPDQITDTVRMMLSRATNNRASDFIGKSFDELVDAIDKPPKNIQFTPKVRERVSRDLSLYRQLESVDVPEVQTKLRTFDNLLTERDLIDEQIANSPGKDLMKYTTMKSSSGTGGRRGLPEITGEGKGKFSRQGDEIIDQMDLSEEDAAQAVDNYQALKERRKDIETEIRAARQELQDELALQRLTEKQIVQDTVVRKSKKLDTEIRQQMDEITEGWVREGYDEAPIMAPGVLNPDNAKAYQLYSTKFQKWLGSRLTEFDDMHHALRRFMQLNKERFNMRGTDDLYESTVNFYGRRSANIEDVDRWTKSVTAAIEGASKRVGVKADEYHKTLSDYQYARQAIDYNAQLGDEAAGISTEAAKMMKERIEALPYFNDMKMIDQEIMAFHKQSLDLLYDYGLLSDDSYRALRTTYTNHVPLQRVMDEDDIAESLASSAFQVTKTGVYRAVGSQREVRDIFDNIVRARVQAINRTEKNLVMKNLYKFAQDNADLVNDKGEKLFIRLNQKEFQKLRPGKQMNTAQMFIDGKKHYVYINDPHLAPAILANAKHTAALGSVVLQTSRLATRMMSALFTQYNPNFGMPNNLRDVQEAAVYLSSIGEGEIAKKLAGKTARMEGHRGVLDWIRGKDTPDARLYDEMRLNGGTSSGSGGLAQLSIDELYDRTDELKNLYHSKPRKTAEQALEVVSNWNRIFEDSTRLAVYKAAKDQGASPERAAFLAKKATIDFDQMGTQMPAINALYMFAKVGTVGSIKALRSLRNPRTLAKTSGVIAGGVAAVNTMNDMFYPDWRDLVTDYERESMLPIVLPSRDGGTPVIIRVPIAYALRPLKVIADRGYDLATGHETDTGKFMWHTMTTTVSSFNPLGGHDILSSFVPTALDVPVEIARNKSWTGNSIVSPFETSKSPHLQYYPSLKDTATGRTLVRFTDHLHFATGISVSPAHLMYAFDQYSGGPGTLLDQMASMTKDIASGELPDMKNVPLASSFIRKRDPKEFFSSSEVYAFSKVIARNRADQNHYVNEAAEDIYVQLKTMNAEEKKNTLRRLLNDSPDVYKKLIKIGEEDKKGLTVEDRNIKSHSISNGDRARVVYFKVYGLDDQQQKEILADYYQKGIVTNDVLNQVQYLIKQQKQPEELIKEPERELIYGETSYIEPPVEGVSDYEAAALGVGGALSMGQVNGDIPKKAPKIKGGKAGLLAGVLTMVAHAAAKNGSDIADASRYTDEVWNQKSASAAGMNAPSTPTTPNLGASAQTATTLTTNPDLPTSTIINQTMVSGRARIPKNEIVGMMKAPGVTQGERDIARRVLDSFDETRVDSQEFIDRMQMEFLPLTPKKADTIVGGTTPELRKSINLPYDELDGWGWYDEVVYESPVNVAAGDIHYNADVTPGYFGHVRRMDSLKGDKRRLIETQSDLMQGNLGVEALRDPKLTSPALTDIYKVLPEAEEIELRRIVDKTENRRPVSAAEDKRFDELRKKGEEILQREDIKEFEKRGAELTSLSSYKKYWLPRILREEVKAAAAEGVKKMQIPTGATAMKIEGLHKNLTWTVSGSDWSARGSNTLTPEKLKVGMTIDRSNRNWEELWIVTEVGDEGKFRAVPKYIWDQQTNDAGNLIGDAEKLNIFKTSVYAESFDVSGKLDTSHGVYRRYENEAGEFLKKEYSATRVKDEFGNEWWEFNVPTDPKKLQINAFGFQEAGPMAMIAGISGAMIGAKALAGDRRIGGGQENATEENMPWEDQPEPMPGIEAPEPIEPVPGVEEPQQVKREGGLGITKDDIVWQEGEYMPYIKVDGKDVLLQEVNPADFPVDVPVKQIVYTNKETGEEQVITDPAQLQVASQIKAVADRVAPEWSNYLLRVARYEGILNDKARNYMSNDTDANGKHYHSNNPEDLADKGGVWSVDRGVFQINDAAFPGVPDEVADDPVRATLFAIAMINANKQERWYADEIAKAHKAEVITE